MVSTPPGSAPDLRLCCWSLTKFQPEVGSAQTAPLDASRHCGAPERRAAGPSVPPGHRGGHAGQSGAAVQLHAHAGQGKEKKKKKAKLRHKNVKSSDDRNGTVVAVFDVLSSQRSGTCRKLCSFSASPTAARTLSRGWRTRRTS